MVEPKNESLTILDNLFNALVEPACRFDELEAHLQRYWKAIRLLGWDESWVVREMKGCAQNDELPSYRLVPATIKWLTVDKDSEPYPTRRENCTHREISPVYELFQYRGVGCFVRTSERQRVLPTMVKRRSGNIISLSSVVGTRMISFDVAYGVAKAAIERFTHGLAQELKEYNIAVNALCPSLTDTEGFGQWMPGVDRSGNR